MESNNLPAPIDLPTELRELSCQIEQWRGTRPHRAAMPEPLWVVAARLARQHGLARVARLLRLDYYSLKDRVENRQRGGSPTSVTKSPAFIELAPLPSNPTPECTIELEQARGRRMRIHIKGAAMSDVTALSRTLWGMKS